MGNGTGAETKCCMGRPGNLNGVVTLGMLASDGSPKSPGPASPRWDWGDVVRGRLYAAGMEQSFVDQKSTIFARAASRLLATGHYDRQTKAIAYWVPGRIVVAGKHTDYAGGRSLLCCVNKGFAVLSVERTDNIVNIYTTINHPPEDKHYSMTIAENTYSPAHRGHWSEDAAVVIRRLAKNFKIEKGVDMVVECDLPDSRGLAFSSAVICFMWTVLAERNDIRSSPTFKANIGSDEQLYTYLGCIENEQNFGDLLGDQGAGNFGGSEDHTAIMSGEAAKMKMYSFSPPMHEITYDFPSRLTFVVACSGGTPLKYDEDQNNLLLLARDAASAWCESTGGLRKLVTFVPGVANLGEIVHHVREHFEAMGEGNAEIDNRVKKTISDAIAKFDDGATYGPRGKGAWTCYGQNRLRERFELFFAESEIYAPGLGDAIAARDYQSIEKWTQESHRLAGERLRTNVPEMAWLQEHARQLNAIGSSAFGEDRGGCCWAIVDKYAAEEFVVKWRSAYVSKFPKWADSCEFFIAAPSTGTISIG